MEQPLTWLQTGYHVLAMLASFVGMMFFLWLYFGMPTRLKPPPRERHWEPDLEPRPDVHVLGSDYPQKDTEFLQHLVKRSYTVPKDPEEYAKIFVPTKDRKGSQNERS